MRRLRMTLGYRGTHYAGWAVQPHRTTVQASVESSLAAVLDHPLRVTAAGRTDAGVHAEGQVVSFDTSSSISLVGLQRVLPHHLPEDIWVDDVSEAIPSFDARRSARRRWYRYALWRHAEPSVGWRGRVLVTRDRLDVGAMRDASRSLLGRHDFTSLVTRPSRHTTSTRTIFAADWLEFGPTLLLFEICADA